MRYRDDEPRLASRWLTTTHVRRVTRRAIGVWVCVIQFCEKVSRGAAQRFIGERERYWSKYMYLIITNTGSNRVSTERCREGGTENESRATRALEVVPLQPARPRRGDTS